MRQGFAFFLVEAIPFSGNHYMLQQIAPVEIIEQSIFWSSTLDHWMWSLKTVSIIFVVSELVSETGSPILKEANMSDHIRKLNIFYHSVLCRKR